MYFNISLQEFTKVMSLGNHHWGIIQTSHSSLCSFLEVCNFVMSFDFKNPFQPCMWQPMHRRNILESTRFRHRTSIKKGNVALFPLTFRLTRKQLSLLFGKVGIGLFESMQRFRLSIPKWFHFQYSSFICRTTSTAICINLHVYPSPIEGNARAFFFNLLQKP